MKTMTDWQQKAVEETHGRRTMLNDLIADSGVLNELPAGRASQHKLTIAVEKNDKERFEQEAKERGFDSLSDMVRSAINQSLKDPEFKHWSLL